MPRSRSIPSYRLHKPSGQAVVTLRDAGGVRRDVYLGEFNSPRSRQEYARIVAELAVSPAQPTPLGDDRASHSLSVNEVLLAFLEHADQHYRGPDGTQTEEYQHVKRICRYVRELYGTTPAAGFGPLAMKAVRQRFVDAGWCRRSVNQHTERVRRAFKWAAGEELVPFDVYHRLTAVTGLSKGRTGAPDRAPVGPVDEAVVDATLPHLNRHVRGLVEFQRLTGCRPGEAAALRRCDLDTTGAVWLYLPPHHKGSWRGKARVIPVGPRAQALLRGFFTPAPEDYLFSPRRAVEEVRAARAASRRTPRYPSHMTRNAAKRKASPARTPAERYNRTSYFTAIARACDRAFPPTGDLARQEGEPEVGWWTRLTPVQRAEVTRWRKAHRWHPNQLRHTFATRIRREHGLEAAQVLLGHSRADVTQVYAERNEALAVGIAGEIG